jgi:hypothetical protein
VRDNTGQVRFLPCESCSYIARDSHQGFGATPLPDASWPKPETPRGRTAPVVFTTAGHGLARRPCTEPPRPVDVPAPRFNGSSILTGQPEGLGPVRRA